MEYPTIKKIRFLKDVGIFRDFQWGNELPELQRFNLIYGWNGSGKTTLSNLFLNIQNKVVLNREKYSIELSNGTVINNSNSKYDFLVRVFNRKYVNDNIFTANYNVEPIFVIGKDNIEKQKSLDDLMELNNDINKTVIKLKNDYDSSNKNLNRIKNSNRDIIKTILSGVDKTYTNYNVNKFDRVIHKMNNDSYSGYILDEGKLNIYIKSVKEDTGEILNLLENKMDDYDVVVGQYKEIIGRKIVAIVIERLRIDDKLNNWVKEGIKYFDNKVYICPFCEQKIEKEYIEKLNKHFNDEYMKIINDINILERNINNVILKYENRINNMYDKKYLYKKYQEEYDNKKEIYVNMIKKYINKLKEMLKLINRKKKNPYSIIDDVIERDNIELMSMVVENINSILEGNNNKTNNINRERKKLASAIEMHYAAKSYREYIDIEKMLEDISHHILQKEKEVIEIKRTMEQLKREMSDHRQPAYNINKELEKYLGHNEIRLDFREHGYVIKRYNEDVKDTLSEGEKTAIALIYFIVSLNDRNTEIENTIVIIDDPVSSLDTNSMCRSVGYIKKYIAKAKQAIIMTHNYVFYKQIKKWKKDDINLYVIENYLENDKRSARINKIDDMLKNYDSEYHYLFKILYKAIKEDDVIKANYIIYPNIARRVIETYGSFKYPDKTSINKIVNIMINDVGEQSTVYQFVNGYSHRAFIEDGSEPDVTFLGETKKVLNLIMKNIERLDKEHYSAMVRIIEGDI